MGLISTECLGAIWREGGRESYVTVFSRCICCAEMFKLINSRQGTLFEASRERRIEMAYEFLRKYEQRLQGIGKHESLLQSKMVCLWVMKAIAIQPSWRTRPNDGERPAPGPGLFVTLL